MERSSKKMVDDVLEVGEVVGDVEEAASDVTFVGSEKEEEEEEDVVVVVVVDVMGGDSDCR